MPRLGRGSAFLTTSAPTPSYSFISRSGIGRDQPFAGLRQQRDAAGAEGLNVLDTCSASEVSETSTPLTPISLPFDMTG